MKSIGDVMADVIVYADIIAAAVVKRMSPADDDIKQCQAYDIYGRKWIDDAVAKGLLHRRRKGHAKNSPVMYSKLEIAALIESEKQMVNELKDFVATH